VNIIMEEGVERDQEIIDNERYGILEQFENLLEPVVMTLGFVWLVLVIIEFVWGSNSFLQALVWTIWAIFLVDFSIRFVLAPHKIIYLRNNWLTALSLFVPALRVLRIARLAQLFYLSSSLRGTELIRVLSSINRGMRSLRGHLQRRRIGYILTLSAIVLLVGAAAMFSFESTVPNGFHTYWDALYWTAMMLTTMGSQYWPQTGAGKVMAFLLALYAFTMFGYITATLATFFIGRETESDDSELATLKSIQSLRAEIESLREDLKNSSDQ
jgi:voltage-gated potassium channel